MKALCLGEILVDFLPGDTPGVYIRKPGGAPANVAVALARFGLEVGFLGMVGDDDFGRFLLDSLRANGVTPLLDEPTSEATTTMAFVTLDETGNRSFTFARKPGADTFLRADQVREEDIRAAALVHAGSCSMSKGTAADATVRALELARRFGRLVSFDLNYRASMWDGDADAAARAVRAILPCVDLLKVSDEEVGMLGGEGALPALQRDNGVALVVETLGAAGARAFWNGETVEIPGLKVPCVDTTGAGDAFWGGVLSSLLAQGIGAPDMLSRDAILRALRRGNIAGSLCVQKKGAMESLPTAAEVDARLLELYPD